MALISGKVYDASGQPAARTVRVYRRDTGALLREVSSAAAAESSDPDYSKVVLLLHCDGSDGSKTFVDSSPSPQTVAVSGCASISTAQSKWWGTGSLKISGLDSDLNIPGPINTAEHFCFEAWVWLNETDADGQTYHTIFGQCNNAAGGEQTLQLSFGSSVLAYERKYSFGSPLMATGTTIVQRKTWTHCALSYDGLNIRGFVSGQKQFEITDYMGWISTALPLRIGRVLVPDYGTYRTAIQGYLDDIRITKGSARYTENFTPPTAPHPDAAYIPAKPLGDYSLTTTYTGEVQVVCLDDAAGSLENDLILRTTPV